MFTVHARYANGAIKRARYSSVASAIDAANAEHASCDSVAVWAWPSDGLRDINEPPGAGSFGRLVASREGSQWRVL